MNKFSSIFGQILQIFSKNEFYRAVIDRDRSGKRSKGVHLLGAVFSDAVLPVGKGTFFERDMWRACKLSWEGKAS